MGGLQVILSFKSVGIYKQEGILSAPRIDSTQLVLPDSVFWAQHCVFFVTLPTLTEQKIINENKMIKLVNLSQPPS